MQKGLKGVFACYIQSCLIPVRNCQALVSTYVCLYVFMVGSCRLFLSQPVVRDRDRDCDHTRAPSVTVTVSHEHRLDRLLRPGHGHEKLNGPYTQITTKASVLHPKVTVTDTVTVIVTVTVTVTVTVIVTVTVTVTVSSIEQRAREYKLWNRRAPAFW